MSRVKHHRSLGADRRGQLQRKGKEKKGYIQVLIVSNNGRVSLKNLETHFWG
jgi:hypothetical protein